MTKQPLIAGSDDCVGAHTPGPWSVQLSPGRGVLSVTSETTWICGELQAENATAIDRRECEANARLIAAAPDFAQGAIAFVEYEKAMEAGNGVAAMMHYATASKLLRAALSSSCAEVGK